MDDTARAVLERLALPNIQCIPLADVETSELRSVRPYRTNGEYCWTLTPFAPGFVFALDQRIERVTYVDADVWMLRSPTRIFREFEASGKAILITEHAYAPEHDQSAISGVYCVQFMTFLRDRGEVVRHWWADRCLEWCFARPEGGKFGDQKYLDDWLDRFPELVHCAAEKASFQAPWNVTRFAPYEAMLFHFQGLRLLRDRHVRLAPPAYSIPLPAREVIYSAYMEDLAWAIDALDGTGFTVRAQLDRSLVSVRLMTRLHMLTRSWTGAFERAYVSRLPRRSAY